MVSTTCTRTLEHVSISRGVEFAQLSKLVVGHFLSIFADRCAQLLLLSFVVLSGPGGEGTGSGAVSLLLPVFICGYPAGLLIDRLNKRRVLALSAVLRGLCVLAAPALLIATAGDRFIPAAFVSGVGIISLFFSLGKFAITPLIVSPRLVWFTNGALWCAWALASLIGITVFFQPGMEAPPADALKFVAAGYLAAAVAVLFIKGAAKPASVLPFTLVGTAVFKYFLTHSRVGDTFRLSVLLSVLSLMWPLLVVSLVLESLQPGGYDLHALLLFVLIGFCAGAGVAPLAVRAQKYIPVLCAATMGSLLSAAAACCTHALSDLRIAAAIGSFAGGIAVVGSDTLLQQTTPVRMRTTIGGCRDALVFGTILTAVYAVEQNADKVALLNILKAVATAQLSIGVILALCWQPMSVFLYRLFLRPVLTTIYNLSLEGGKDKLKADLYLCNRVPAMELGIISGAMANQRYVILEPRVNPLLSFLARLSGGYYEASPERTLHRSMQLSSRGYRVWVSAREINKESNELSSLLVRAAANKKIDLAPSLIERRRGLHVRIGDILEEPSAAAIARCVSELAEQSEKSRK